MKNTKVYGLWVAVTNLKPFKTNFQNSLEERTKTKIVELSNSRGFITNQNNTVI